jgi:hypothetical protein
MGPYSQNFIFFSNKWARQARVLHYIVQNVLFGTNARAYWAHLKVLKQLKYDKHWF